MDRITTEDLKSMIGEGVHTGFRKGTDAKGSHKAWVAIGANESGWDEVLDYVMWGLGVTYPDGFTWVPEG